MPRQSQNPCVALGIDQLELWVTGPAEMTFLHLKYPLEVGSCDKDHTITAVWCSLLDGPFLVNTKSVGMSPVLG